MKKTYGRCLQDLIDIGQAKSDAKKNMLLHIDALLLNKTNKPISMFDFGSSEQTVISMANWGGKSFFMDQFMNNMKA